MKRIDDFYNQPILIKGEIVSTIDENKDINSYIENDFNNLDVGNCLGIYIQNENDEVLDSMSGYYLVFNDFDELIGRLDSENEDLVDIISKAKKFITDSILQHAYINYSTSANMDIEIEYLLHYYLDNILFQTLYYRPKYILSFIHKEVWDGYRDKLEYINYRVIGSTDDYYMVCKVNDEY